MASSQIPAAEKDQPVKPVADPELQKTLDAIRQKHGVPALGAALLDARGLQTLAVSGVRKAGSSVAVTIGDQWHLGSDTKAMTATLLAALIEQKKLKADSTLAEIYPELQLKAPVAEITLPQLLSHRSGLPANTDWRALSRSGGSLVKQRHAAVALLGETKLLSQPGTAYSYSNWNFVVAGAIAETVAKKPYEELLRTFILDPLHMDATGFGWAGTAGKIDQPWGHRQDGSPIQADNPPIMVPAGGVHCSLEDWAKFVTDQLRGAQGKPALLQPGSYRHLQHPAPGETYFGGWIRAERTWGGGTVFNHGGSNTYNLAIAWMAPAREFACLVTCNQGGTEKACDDVVVALIKRARLQS